MRIAIDMLGSQSPHSRHRGIGRYTNSLVDAILADARGKHQITLLYHQGLPVDPLLHQADYTHFLDAKQSKRISQPLNEYVAKNADKHDAFLITSPMESYGGYLPPARPVNQAIMSAICYDLIPGLFPERYLSDLTTSRHYFRQLQLISRYDSLLCISEATNTDIYKTLDIPRNRVHTVGTASDPSFFEPGPIDPALLEKFGIDSPFVLSVSGMDGRKNFLGFMTAFSKLPESMRQEYQAVLTCKMTASEAELCTNHAKKLGILDRLVLTNFVTDEELRNLYRACAVFVFPSSYEGFGLPILEAMMCGAPVLGGNNSSQIELVEGVGRLVNPADAGDIALHLEAVLSDRSEREQMRSASLAHSKNYRWEDSAKKTISILEVVHRKRAAVKIVKRPELAMFGPLLPLASGIADYTEDLAEELGRHFRIDFFYEGNYRPNASHQVGDHHFYDARMFPVYQRVKQYTGRLYQVGNSEYHRYFYQTMLNHPGVMVLHDMFLGGLHHTRSLMPGADPQSVRNEIKYELAHHPELSMPDINMPAHELIEWARNNRVWLCKRIANASRGVIVHSEWTRNQIAPLLGQSNSKTEVIAHGAKVHDLNNVDRVALRSRFGLSPSKLLVGSFGILAATKMNVESLIAFEALAAKMPEAAMLFVGRELDEGVLRRKVEELNLTDRVHFFPSTDAADFERLIWVTDLAFNLRRPPTNGESSGTLLKLLAAGVPTIVTDVGSFGEFSSDAVVKVQVDENLIDNLTQRLFEIAHSRELRQVRGMASRQLVVDHFDWKVIAAQYADAIHRFMGNSMAGTSYSFSELRSAS
jgi:glycosyltransferase involved in cell wall biosynthesis